MLPSSAHSTAPAPAGPGFPFEAPSNSRMQGAGQWACPWLKIIVKLGFKEYYNMPYMRLEQKLDRSLQVNTSYQNQGNYNDSLEMNSMGNFTILTLHAGHITDTSINFYHVSATVGTLKLCIIISGFKNENICIL